MERGKRAKELARDGVRQGTEPARDGVRQAKERKRGIRNNTDAVTLRAGECDQARPGWVVWNKASFDRGGVHTVPGCRVKRVRNEQLQ